MTTPSSGKTKQFFQRIRRSLVKRLLALIGLPRNCNAYDYIDGIWSKGYPLPRYYDVYWKDKFVFRSHDIGSLPKQDNEDVFIIGSGPSIKNQSIEKLAQRKTILLNGAISLIKTKGLNPFLVVIIDNRFIRKHSDIVHQIPNSVPLAIPFRIVREIILMDPDFFKGRVVYIVEEGTNALDYETPEEILVDAFDRIDTVGVFPNPGTVMGTAIQIASYLRFKNVYLIGFDLGNSNQPRFYETSNHKTKSELLESYQVHILPFMKIASLYYSTKGSDRAIWNCSPVSLLPYSIIGYKDFDEL